LERIDYFRFYDVRAPLRKGVCLHFIGINRFIFYFSFCD